MSLSLILRCLFYSESENVRKCSPELCEPFKQIIELEEGIVGTTDRWLAGQKYRWQSELALAS